MRLYRILLIELFTFVTFSAFGQTKLENELFSDLIKGRFKVQQYDTIYKSNGKIKKIKTNEKLKFILITETDSTWAKYLYDSIDEFYELNNECFTDYIEKNKSVIQVDTIPDFNGKIIYLTNKELNKTLKNGGWDNYYKKFGFLNYVKVSRPGFNKAQNKAIINISSYSGGESGGNLYLLLEKRENRWEIKEIIGGSVS